MKLLSVICLSALLVACHSTNIADIKPGERPSEDSDIGGMWYQLDKAEEEIKQSPSRIRDPELNAYLTDLVCKIAGSYCPDIRVYLIDVPYFNASMAPNGMMIIWSGLLLRSQSEAQVASVIGHEVGHYVKQHSLKQWRTIKNMNNALLGVGLSGPAGSIIGQTLGAGAFFKFSRDHERESDAYGLERLKSLGYNPIAAAEVWVLVKEEANALPKNQTAYYFSTHPLPKERIINLGGSFDMKISTPDKDYQAKIEHYYPKWLKREISKRQYNASEVVLNRLAQTYPNHATINYYQAELYRRRNEEHDLNKAHQHYLKAIQLGYNNPKIYKQLAELNLKREKHDLAIQNYQQYLELANLSTAEKTNTEAKILKLRSQSQ